MRPARFQDGAKLSAPSYPREIETPATTAPGAAGTQPEGALNLNRKGFGKRRSLSYFRRSDTPIWKPKRSIQDPVTFAVGMFQPRHTLTMCKGNVAIAATMLVAIPSL